MDIQRTDINPSVVAKQRMDNSPRAVNARWTDTNPMVVVKQGTDNSSRAISARQTDSNLMVVAIQQTDGNPRAESARFYGQRLVRKKERIEDLPTTKKVFTIIGGPCKTGNSHHACDRYTKEARCLT